MSDRIMATPLANPTRAQTPVGRATEGTDVAPRFGGGSRPRRRSEAEDEEILTEARERFTAVIDWESDFRAAFVNDVRFVNGDADNSWQWPDGLLNERGSRPSLTVNKTRQHCLQIVNDARQNKPEVKITAVSDQATKEAAEIFEGVVRHIEYISDATTTYDMATEHQVQGGIGWWRIVTDYESEDSFDQEIRIRCVPDALSIYMDPDIHYRDGSDARFAFVVDDVPRDQFEAKYPEYKDNVPQTGYGIIDGGWVDEDHVRVAEYYRRSDDADTLHQLPDGSTLRESDLADSESLAQLRAMSVRSREITEGRIEWFKIVGGTIVDRKDWPGKYIPLIRVIGEETTIEGRLERKGHARAMKDPQRIYNYWTSAGVESVALQSKVPYLAPAEAIENYQHIWDTANTENHPVLPWKARDDQGQPLPPPQRQDPPTMGQAYIQGLQIAQQEMMMVSGQYAPQMGQPQPSETSGKAIALRQRQGDNATYHYVDNLGIAIRFTGRQLIDLIPKVYDTRRVLRILQSDGSVDQVQVDPNAPVAAQQLPDPTHVDPAQLQQAVTRIFNPNIGRYEVQADVGPSYATRRQEAFNAFTQIVTTAPQLMQVAGDLLFRAADFPMAEELAERLQRMVPPQALGQGPSPGEQQMQQALQQMQQQLQGAQAHVALMAEKLAVAEMKLKSRAEQKDIDAYEAVTDRLGTLLNAEKTDSPYVAGMEIRALIAQMVRDAMMTGGMAAVGQATQADIAMGSMMGGQQGPQGAPPGPPGAPPGPPPLPPSMAAPGPTLADRQGLPQPPGGMHPLAAQVIQGPVPGVPPGVFGRQHAAMAPVAQPSGLRRP